MVSVSRHYNRYPCQHLTSDRGLDYLKNQTLIRRLFPLPAATDKILDVGCGAAAVIERLADRYWHKKVTAIDSSRVSLAAAKSLAPADYRLADAAALPFASNSFDLVLSCGMIHHSPDYRKIFKEISRVLKPAGRFYLTVYNYSHPYRWLYAGFAPWRRFFPGFWLKLLTYPYWLVYSFLSFLVLGEFAARSEARADLADRLFVPYARFFKADELAALFKINNLVILARGRHALGTMASYLVQKHA